VKTMNMSVKDNTQEFKNQSTAAMQKALEEIGIKVEKYAKALCPVGTSESTGTPGYRGGTLRRSITHEVVMESETKGAMYAGSNVEYAPYVELGTGPYFTPPPEWETFKSTKGSGVGAAYVHARPFLKPAIQDHMSTYQSIIKNNLTGS